MASVSSGCTILVVRYGLEPLGGQSQVDGEVRHSRRRGGTMPVFFVGLDCDGVAGRHVSNGLAPFLNQTAPFLHQQQLRCAVTVPVRAATGFELDEIDDDGLAALFHHRQLFDARRSDKILRIRRLERHGITLQMLHWKLELYSKYRW